MASMGHVTITVSYRMLEVVDQQTGLWCDHCLLPSATQITLAWIAVIGGVEQPMQLSTGVRCDDGHGWLPTPATG